MDPIFYSTCLVWGVTTEWLPIASDTRETNTIPASNYSGWCLDCDSYYSNFLNKSVDPTMDTPQWYFADQVI